MGQESITMERIVYCFQRLKGRTHNAAGTIEGSPRISLESQGRSMCKNLTTVPMNRNGKVG